MKRLKTKTINYEISLLRLRKCFRLAIFANDFGFPTFQVSLQLIFCVIFGFSPSKGSEYLTQRANKGAPEDNAPARTSVEDRSFPKSHPEEVSSTPPPRQTTCYRFC